MRKFLRESMLPIGVIAIAAGVSEFPPIGMDNWLATLIMVAGSLLIQWSPAGGSDV